MECTQLWPKATVERMKVVNNMINRHQITYIKGRWITVIVLIASECVDRRIRGEVAGLI